MQTWTQSLLAYGTVIPAILLGAVLGCLRGHRRLTVLLGPAIGLAVILIAYVLLPNEPVAALGGFGWYATVRLDTLGFVVLYLVTFGIGVLVSAAIHRRDDLFGAPPASCPDSRRR